MADGAATVDGALLRTSALSKTFGLRRALDAVDIAFFPGRVHALLGGNGSGKSTLIKILAGVERADAGGRITVGGTSYAADDYGFADARKANIRVVHQDLALFDDLTVAENLAIGHGFPTQAGRIRWNEARRWARDFSDRHDLGIDPRQAVGELRPVQRTMVAIARVMRDADELNDAILFLDEPTAGLPDSETQELYEHLTRCAHNGQAVIVVTHRLDEALAHADLVCVLRDGRLIESRPVDGLDQGRLVELMLGRVVDSASRSDTPLGSAREPLLTVRNLHSGPIRGFELDVRPGEVVGIAGIRGAGRSRILRAIFGDLQIDDGEIVVGGRKLSGHGPAVSLDADIVYLPEDRRSDAAFMDLCVRENLTAGSTSRYWNGLRFRHRAEREDSRVLIEQFLIRARSPEQPLQELSGGNQQKVIIGRSLRRVPQLLLLDEPSQGVDVGARAEIYELLRAATGQGAAALIVASDFEELAQVCDRVVVLRGGRNGGQLAAPDIRSGELTRMTYDVEAVA